MQRFHYQRKHNGNIGKSEPFKMEVLVNDFFFRQKVPNCGVEANENI